MFGTLASLPYGDLQASLETLEAEQFDLEEEHALAQVCLLLLSATGIW